MKKYGLMPADILLPNDNFEKWAVIACDQFTSEGEYWKDTEKIVGNTPSSLRIVLPEIYLNGNIDGRIDKINSTMNEYLKNGVLTEHKDSMIYVERTQSDGTVRHGIIGCIDLDDYDYAKDSHALIRSTEKTVVERIPPRVKIRKGAVLELPHVLLLIDDAAGTVIEPLKRKTDSMEKAYDFDLMQGGGHIRGWFIKNDESDRIGKSINALIEGESDKMMFAVGDGNHSLATAKECSRKCDSTASHSALVEVVNVHDPSIVFEPIYRVLFGTNNKLAVKDFTDFCGGLYFGDDAQKFTCVTSDGSFDISVKPLAKLPVGTLQVWLDTYTEKANVTVDYIHDEESVRALCTENNTLGFLFDGMKKDELFEAVKADGSLPRKTFSMGHARDKRYYLEARVIK